MRCIFTYLRTVLPCIFLLSLAGCAKEGIIGRKTMAEITREMFLADQYIEKRPHLMAQTDSDVVYPAILGKYGYTPEDYSNSVAYYLSKGEAYNRILKQVQAQVEERMQILDDMIDRERTISAGPSKWWALDSVRSIKTDELVYDPLLRGVRWLVIPNEKLEKWKINDSAVVDIPQNPIWWDNNIQVPLEREHFTYFSRK